MQSELIELADLAGLEVKPVKSAGYMSGYERSVIVALLKGLKAETVVEIGIQRGEMARLILDHVPSVERYIGIDVLPGYRTALAIQQDEIPAVPGELVLGDRRVELILSRSGSLDVMAQTLPRCDAVIIDGDHGRDAVHHDSALAYAVTRPNGLIFWHDYYSDLTWASEVREVIHELRDAGRDIKRIADTWIAIAVN